MRLSSLALALTTSGSAFSPGSLFAAGEQGAWYDPSDLTTLFQDSAGTTPVTAVEQPVGLMLDKSGRNNHASQSTSVNRPTLSARYNLLTYSEQFDNAAWNKANATISANTTVAPDGTTTADTANDGTGTGYHRIGEQTITFTSATSYVMSAYFKYVDRQYVRLLSHAGSNLYASAIFDVQNGTVAATNASGSGWSITSSSITAAGNGFWRATVQFVSGSSASAYPSIYMSNGTTFDAYGADQYTGSNKTVVAWGAQLIVTNSLLGNAYQRVQASGTYDSNPTLFPYYLKFNGSSSSMATNSIDFSTVTSDGQARRNLLTYPTAFDNAAWTKPGVTVTADSATAPDGTSTADLIAETTATSTHLLNQSCPFISGLTYTLSVYAKKGTGATAPDIVQVTLPSANFGATQYANYNLSTGAVGTTGAGATASIVNIGSGWYRLIYSATATSTSSNTIAPIVFTNNNDGLGRAPSYAGQTTSNVLLWGAQVEQHSSVTAFQNIGTDKMTVWAGVRKASDAGIGSISELGTSFLGSFTVFGSVSGNPNYGFGDTSSFSVYQTGSTPNSFAAPVTNVLAGSWDLSQATMANQIKGRVNAVAMTLSFGGAGTPSGNFMNGALYIGARGGSSLYFNGNIYSLIVRGAASDAGQISSGEYYVNSKTKAY